MSLKLPIFKPRLWPTILTLLMLTLMCGLGIWQVQRLHWKQGLLATIDQRTHEAPQNVAVFTDAATANYHPATASGIFLNNHNFFMLAISLSGEGGYHVLTPFKLDDGHMLLVDRGWIPYDHRENFSKPEGPVKIAGILRASETHLFTPKNDVAQNNWYQIDLSLMAQNAGLDGFLPFTLEINDAPNIGGYPVGGQTRITLPNNHFGYAMTWFGLAVVLLIIYLIYSCQQKNAED